MNPQAEGPRLAATNERTAAAVPATAAADGRPPAATGVARGGAPDRLYGGASGRRVTVRDIATGSSSATTATAGRATRCLRSTSRSGRRSCAPTSASAEMIKLAANAFLATKISFINEIANVCEETGANVLEVARGVGLDERIGPKFLSAGIGYGGSCFTKDVSALKLLAANSGYHFQLLGAVIEVNELQKRRVVAKLARHLGSLAGRRIGVLGLAFKPNTDDMRGASSLVLAARLEAEGAHVRAYDPVAADEARTIMPELDCAAASRRSSTAPTRSCSSPSGRSSSRSTGARSRRRWRATS